MLALVLAAALMSEPCANPSIVSAGLQSVTPNGALKHYTVAIVVQNQGSVRQPSNLLQSVDVFQADERVGRLGLQPLRPSESQKVLYSFDRSNEAGDGTTDIIFTLNFNGMTGSDVNCHAGNETYRISV